MDDFRGLGPFAAPVNRGRHAINNALHEASPEGAIAADEFSVIDHGIGVNGRPTYTVNLPGVIDLSKPVPGFDPHHASVRDMDSVALRSAPTASVDDNLYAQFVKRGLRVNGVPLGSNLMLVGHSFGADTVLDLAADSAMLENYKVTHVVAAAYDSVPQLAAVSPDIDVLVLQNTADQAIALEAFHRRAGTGDHQISINTFAHEIRRFDGGFGTDVGHHPDRYIAYLNEANDAELERFLTSVDGTGYGRTGSTVAIDVSLDPALAPPNFR